MNTVQGLSGDLAVIMVLPQREHASLGGNPVTNIPEAPSKIDEHYANSITILTCLMAFTLEPVHAAILTVGCQIHRLKRADTAHDVNIKLIYSSSDGDDK